MLNRRLLSGKIAGAGYNQKTLAAAIGMSENALSLKMTGKSVFNTEQIDRICQVLNINDNSEKADIFLA